METSVNNKSRAFTSLEQSRKLADILPLESADMYYACGAIAPPDIMIGNKQDYRCYTRCWSLAALLDVLPNNEHINTTLSRGSWKKDTVEYLPDIWWCEFANTKNQTEFTASADNPVDACYEMIIMLSENGLV